MMKDEAVRDLRTVRDFIRWGVSRFTENELYFGHGTDNALDESLALVLHALHLPFGLPDSLLEGRLTQAEKASVVELLVQRIEKRLPAAYLTNKALFCGIPFYVDERVLVPRSPIAELIEQQFDPWVKPDEVVNILDLCTGSGCIAIASAYMFPSAQVDGVDISKDALAVANINIKRHELVSRVSAIQSDLFSSVVGKKYQIIVSNPPYVDAGDIASMPQEFHQEPAIGLASGVDGLDITRKILSQAAAYLTDDGILVVEVGNSEAALQKQLPSLPFTWLEFEHGGHGVFLLSHEQLIEHKDEIQRWARK
ncbi:MAG: 50S ribosomal protein L3 N(5)-glutamine methyltransferase [Gammaproteobacteria bacterium]|nr:50S ribosomal protein L3 N(5)-glutamine methyltransferase [Gammaproteobacteria bacterium]MCF6231031.1 50S ribosomal protein L3 N(5)-glutamine methyltransferase [Gammaproteobacteria bacterium]